MTGLVRQLSPVVVCGPRAKNVEVVCPFRAVFRNIFPTDYVGKHDPKIKGKFGKRVEKRGKGSAIEDVE